MSRIGAVWALRTSEEAEESAAHGPEAACILIALRHSQGQDQFYHLKGAGGPPSAISQGCPGAGRRGVFGGTGTAYTTPSRRKCQWRRGPTGSAPSAGWLSAGLGAALCLLRAL